MKREILENLVLKKAKESDARVNLTKEDFDYFENMKDKMCNEILMLPNYETLEVAVKTAKIINNKNLFKKIYKIATDNVDDIDQLPLFGAVIMYQKDDTNPDYKYVCNMMKLNIRKYGQKDNQKQMKKQK